MFFVRRTITLHYLYRKGTTTQHTCSLLCVRYTVMELLGCTIRVHKITAVCLVFFVPVYCESHAGARHVA